MSRKGGIGVEQYPTPPDSQRRGKGQIQGQ
nr:MAG TPA: hypothetical protein [Caudoviricetes sp.]